ncbi:MULTISPECIES: roadblock/LC7 domain-containing protein [Acinetobacter]|jgi:predicted regulator of Ras-like GTPase activity (Roadblock/LC7/MglB family)|uniref:Roadblock/LC7 domain-containing protein n=2 Tax=Acinetobacter TaxID=469 RepID=A0A4Q7AS81_9GAMM|nr:MULTISPECIES: roadblock/LC7 domain-containing protein [Acinetobacter]MCW8040356.1 roadblock/LC7 domain-containing protein [Acinetobacter entericus]QXW25507.1 roadblock/LC7 domain-containing protein [Acinetobacter johnsonii]RZG64646.1 roadblock/LC7 domain-containing protein [Acinetobacter bouvetii]TCB75910.1 roadblock/LC7 domain-containing protein [Acinetobacter sp. ANC 4177]
MFNIKEKRVASAELIDKAKQELQDIISNVRGVNFVMVCSTDGFELASLYKRDIYNKGKLAAVSSSILAMVTAFTQEIHLTGCQSITLDAENGKVVLSAIAAKNHPMIIVAMADKDVLLGQLLYAIKKTTHAIKSADLELI